MKNKFYLILFSIFLAFEVNSYSEEFKITSSSIKADKNSGNVILEEKVKIIDENNNQLFTDYAEYNKIQKTIFATGDTNIITAQGFKINGSNILFDDKNKTISSNAKTQIIDKSGNKIFLEMFDYSIKKNLIFSKGNIRVEDINSNKYNFSEIYIDEKEEKIIGSDVRFYLDQIKVSENNEPRFFANSASITKEGTTMNKSVFTFCRNKSADKCPPWLLQAERIKHDPAKKTIYYDNAVIKIYDFPVFYYPKFSHPDPSVKRRSGFMVPTFTSNKTVGPGLTQPYFWAISGDKDLTFAPKIHTSENPLMLAEYRQAFEKSLLLLDVGYSTGYKNTSNKKTAGSKSHFFSQFSMNLKENENEFSNLNFDIQQVSGNKYLKRFDINSMLASESFDVLENNVTFDYQKEDLSFVAELSAFENLTVNGNEKYEYQLPFLTLEKNILNNQKYGFADLSSRVQVKNLNTNQHENFFVNDIDWSSNKWISENGIENQFRGIFKTVNYETENTNGKFKDKEDVFQTSGAIGYLAKTTFYKNKENKNHQLKPKLLMRYAPGHMRNLTERDGRLRYSNLFNMSKFNHIDVLENGLSTSYGFEYEYNSLSKKQKIEENIFSFSAGQVVNSKKNLDLPKQSSMKDVFSDIVGRSSFNINKDTQLTHKFSIDKNVNELSSNEISLDQVYGKTKFNISYLEERNHIGDRHVADASIEYDINSKNQLVFNTTRNLLKNSSDYYDLSYNYINDCLKAGLVYRRQFYSDKDTDAEDSLLFKVTLIPLGQIKSPSLGQ
jgi:LPS-assembly protein